MGVYYIGFTVTRATAVYYLSIVMQGAQVASENRISFVCVCVGDRRGAVHWMTPTAWGSFAKYCMQGVEAASESRILCMRPPPSHALDDAHRWSDI